MNCVLSVSSVSILCIFNSLTVSYYSQFRSGGLLIIYLQSAWASCIKCTTVRGGLQSGRVYWTWVAAQWPFHSPYLNPINHSLDNWLLTVRTLQAIHCSPSAPLDYYIHVPIFCSLPFFLPSNSCPITPRVPSITQEHMHMYADSHHIYFTV